MDKIRRVFGRCFLFFSLSVAGVLLFGCTTARTLPPILDSVPDRDSVGGVQLLDIPEPPEPRDSTLKIHIPMQPAYVGEMDFVTRKDVVIEPGKSFVISVPISPDMKLFEGEISEISGFRTDGYFNMLEQFIERELLSAGFHVKDRNKFEAMLRNIRDSQTLSVEHKIALEKLRGDYESDRISREEFIERSKQLRDRLLDPLRGGPGRIEMSDIAEVIRAAQDGDARADYVLQINRLFIRHYSGEPLEIGGLEETKSFLRQRPGLSTSRTGISGTLPYEVKQPWLQAGFNAKLICIDTGKIDWIGDYTIDSLAVFEDGVRISIDVSEIPANADEIIRAIKRYNTSLAAAHRRLEAAEQHLGALQKEAVEPVSYTVFRASSKDDEDKRQDLRRRNVEQAENEYVAASAEYKRLVENIPHEAKMDWAYTYRVGSPKITPDFTSIETEQDRRLMMDHVNKLAEKVLGDLLKTIMVSSLRR